MKRTFVETRGFRGKVEKAGGDELLRTIQNAILKDPEVGATVAGTGGVRKMRAEDVEANKGKSGGYRVIYLDLPRACKTLLIVLYGKKDKGNISAAEKKMIKALVTQIKKEAGEL
jgi:hypothetical protein